MVSPLCGACRLTLGSYYEIPEIVKPCVPPSKAGVSLFLLESTASELVSAREHPPSGLE